jgi:hypothetical protein
LRGRFEAKPGSTVGKMPKISPHTNKATPANIVTQVFYSASIVP